jgi:hypothetical protein
MPIAPGTRLPEVAAHTLDGAPAPFAALAVSGPALLLVYKGDCAASVIAAGVLPRFAAVRGLNLAALSQDDGEETRRFAAASGWGAAVAVLRDAEPWAASDALGILVTPTWILAAPGGRVEAVEEGWSRDAANRLAARAAALAGADPVVVAAPDGAEPPFRPG